MSEPNNSAWPFTEISESEGFDIDAIFGSGNGTANQGNPFEAPAAAAQPAEPAAAPVVQEAPPASASAPESIPAASTAAPASTTQAPAPAAPAAEPPAENPIAAAFEQKTVENTKVGLLEKPPVFYHKTQLLSAVRR